MVRSVGPGKGQVLHAQAVGTSQNGAEMLRYTAADLSMVAPVPEMSRQADNGCRGFAFNPQSS